MSSPLSGCRFASPCRTAGYTLPMDDTYRALARAVRRPMRRWWRKVGVWWVAFLLACLTTSLVLVHSLSSSMLVLEAGILCRIAFEVLCLVLWLVVAGQVLAACRSIIHDYAHPFPVTLERAQFMLVVIHTVPLMLLLLLERVVPIIISYVSDPDRAGLVADVLWPGCWHSHAVASAALLAMWLAALLVIIPSRPWIPWAIACVAVLLPQLIGATFFIQDYFTGGAAYAWFMPYTKVSDLSPSLGWLVGLALTLAMIRFYRRRSPRLGTTCLVMLMLAAHLHGSYGSIYFLRFPISEYPALAALLDFVRSWHEFLVAPLVRFRLPPGVESSAAFEGSGYLTSVIPISWSVEAPTWVVYCVPLLNALYIAAIVAFIYYLLLAPQSQRAQPGG